MPPKIEPLKIADGYFVRTNDRLVPYSEWFEKSLASTREDMDTLIKKLGYDPRKISNREWEERILASDGD